MSAHAGAKRQFEITTSTSEARIPRDADEHFVSDMLPDRSDGGDGAKANAEEAAKSSGTNWRARTLGMKVDAHLLAAVIESSRKRLEREKTSRAGES